MAFNPLEERGIPLDDQLRTWRELNVDPYDKRTVDPYTRCRVIAMNGIEVEANLFSHQMARNVDIPEIREKLAQVRRVEAQQQKAINWLTPADETTLEVTLGYEQVAVDLTAWLARMEPDPYIRQTLEFGLLEDFDHLYRYANLYELLEGKQAEQVVAQLTEVMPGRPTVEEHRHPVDDHRRHWDAHTADPRTKLHTLTVMAAEQQTMNFYNTIGNRYMEPLARGLYLEIAMIEEQHVTQYESLLDPAMSWLENLALHEYNECYLYHSFLATESDPRIRALWETHLAMEIEQLKAACELLQRYEGRDPAEVLPLELPDPVTFEPNKDFIRQVLADQVEMTTDRMDFDAEKHGRYQSYQDAVHGGEQPPSELVIDQAVETLGRDHRLETGGDHPVERLRSAALTQRS